jgi:hypothetical protein
LALDLLKRANCNEQDLDGANFLVRRSSREIFIWGYNSPLAPVETVRAEQQGSRQKTTEATKLARANKKADRRSDRDRLALREFQFPE